MRRLKRPQCVSPRRVPREFWGESEKHGGILPLDLDAEVRRWGGSAGPVD